MAIQMYEMFNYSTLGLYWHNYLPLLFSSVKKPMDDSQPCHDFLSLTDLVSSYKNWEFFAALLAEFALTAAI